MPITVQHGIPASPGLIGLAQTAMQIRAAEEARRRQGLTRGVSGGGGRRDADPAEMARYKAELGERETGQQYELDTRKMHEQAQVQADLFEYKYTTQQKHEYAKILNDQQTLAASPDFTEEQKEKLNRLYELKKAGFDKPTATLRDLDKIDPPEGQEFGKLWIHPEFGGLYRTVMDASGHPKPEVVIRPDQMLEAQEREAELEIQKGIQELRTKLAGTTIKSAPELGKAPVDRFPTPEEIQTQLEAAYPHLRAEREAVEQKAKMFKQRDKLMQIYEKKIKSFKWNEPRDLMNAVRKMRVFRTEEEAGLPEHAARAQVFIRAILEKEKRGEPASEYEKRIFQQAREILEAYEMSVRAERGDF